MISRIRLFGLLLMALSVTGCGGKTETPAPPPPPSPPATTTPANPPAPQAAPQVAVTSPAGQPGGTAMPTPTGIPGSAPGTPGANVAKPATGADGKQATEADSEFMKRVRQAVQDASSQDALDSLKEIGLAFHQYGEEHDQQFPTIDGIGSPDSPRGLSWRVYLLPYLGKKDLYDQFHLNEAWDSPHNATLIPQIPTVFGADPDGRTRLHLITGKGVPFQPSISFRPQDIKDGTSNTILVVEAGQDKADTWTKPGGLIFDETNARGVLGNVGENFHALLFDGTSQIIASDFEWLPLLMQHQDYKRIEGDFSNRNPLYAALEALVEMPPLQQVSEELDLRYLPTDATGVLILSPRRILRSQIVQEFLKQLALEGESTCETLRRLTMAPKDLECFLSAVEEIRLFPRKETEAIAANGSELPLADVESADVYLRSSIPLPIELILRDFIHSPEGVDIENVNGIPHVWLRKKPVSLAFPSEHEMIIAAPDSINWILSAANASDKMSPLIDALKSQGNRMVMLAVNAPEGGKLDFLQQALGAAGPAAMFVPQLAEANAIQFSLDLEAPEFVRLSLGFLQEQMAQGLGTVLQGLITQGQRQGQTYLSMLKPDDPTRQVKTDLINELTTGTHVSNDGTKVSLTINHLPHLGELPAAFQNEITAAQMPVTPVEDLPPMEQIAKAMVAYQEVNGHLPAANGTGAVEEVKPKGPRQGRANGNSTEKTPATIPAPLQLPNANVDPTATSEAPTAEQAAANEKLAAAIAKNKGLSWRVYLLPMLGQQELFARFKLDERWDSPHNKPLVSEMPAVYGESADGKSRIHMIVGNDTLFKSGKAPDLESLRDAPEQTLVLIETGAEKADFWTKPGGLPFDSKHPTKCLGKPDADQTDYQTIMLDWSSQLIPVDIDPAEFNSLVQPSDGKPARKE